MVQELIGLPDLAIRLRQDYRLVYGKVLKGQFGQPVRNGGRWFVPRAAVEAFESSAASAQA